MEDENADDNQTPKKDGQRVTSSQDLNRRSKHEDQVSNSESFSSGSYSGKSGIEIAGASKEMPTTGKTSKQVKQPEKKRRGRRPGKVEKRRRSHGRRVAPRKLHKRKPNKERTLSVSTIFTGLSSQSDFMTPGCKFCGHRCCRRRFEYERDRKVKRNRRIRKVKPRKVKMTPRFIKGSKLVQVGSRCNMFSPLFINTNATHAENERRNTITFCEITPEIIYQALKKLTMWRQCVPTEFISDYIMRNYPVNSNEVVLMQELMHKLRIAALVGIVIEVVEGYWCLNSALLNRTLDESHVTKFWQVYLDTMVPLGTLQSNAKKQELNKNQSDAKNRKALELN